MKIITTVIVIYFYFFFAFAVVFKFNPPTEFPSFVNSLMFPLYLSILMTIFLFYGVKINSKVENNISFLIKLRELYPIAPLFIMSMGFSFLLLSLVFSSKFLGYSGFTFIYFGLILFVIAILAKSFLEQRIYFNLKEANRIINKIDYTNKNQADIYNLKNYIRLVFKNINERLGRGLELRTCEDTNNCSKLEYTLINYLPNYIKLGDKEQIESAKNHLEAMLNSVDEDDNIKWKMFTTEVMKLTEEITSYLKDTNFYLTYRSSPKELEWIDSNKNLILKIIGLIIAIVSVYIQSQITPRLP